MVIKCARKTVRKIRAGSRRDFASYATLSRLTGVPASTLWHRANGRLSRRKNAANQQYLTPQEEDALLHYVLRMADNGLPLPVKSTRSLALITVRQRSGQNQMQALQPPGKNWPQGFLQTASGVESAEAQSNIYQSRWATYRREIKGLVHFHWARAGKFHYSARKCLQYG